MTIQYIEFTTKPGYATIWDTKPTGFDSVPVTQVLFKDGTVGLLPVSKIEALTNVLDYGWQDELRNWQEDTDFDTAEPFVTDMENDEGMHHIVHDFAALRMIEGA